MNIDIFFSVLATLLSGLPNGTGEEEDYLVSCCIGILIEKGVFNEGCWFNNLVLVIVGLTLSLLFYIFTIKLNGFFKNYLNS